MGVGSRAGCLVRLLVSAAESAYGQDVRHAGRDSLRLVDRMLHQMAVSTVQQRGRPPVPACAADRVKGMC